MHPHPRTKAGLTLAELLVIIVLLFFAVLLFFPCMLEHGALTRAQMTQTLSNMKQLHLATDQMARDGKTNLGWPGDTGGTFSNWTTSLVESEYLTTRDLAKLLSAPGIPVPTNSIPVVMEKTALRLYAAGTNSDATTVFLTTANFTNTPTGGVAPLPDAKPYQNRGFVVFRVDGYGTILRPRQAGQTNLVGAFAPLVR